MVDTKRRDTAAPSTTGGAAHCRCCLEARTRALTAEAETRTALDRVRELEAQLRAVRAQAREAAKVRERDARPPRVAYLHFLEACAEGADLEAARRELPEAARARCEAGHVEDARRYVRSRYPREQGDRKYPALAEIARELGIPYPVGSLRTNWLNMQRKAGKR